MRKSIIVALLALFIITPISQVLAVGTNYRFTGQELDPEAGLYYYGQRYYNPNDGRFTQPDPLANYLTNPQKLKQTTGQDLQQFLTNPQQLNSYSYVQNNPIKYVDPEGEFSFTAAGIAIGGIVGMGYSYRNVYSYFKNVFRGDIYAASDDVESFLNSTTNGAIIGGTIGLTLDTIWGLITLTSLANQTQQLTSKVRDITLTGRYDKPYLQKLQSAFQYLQEKGINVGEHALNKMFKKGFSVQQVEEVYNSGVKFLDKKYNNLNLIKDGIRIIIDPNNQNKIENILDIKNISPNRFIQLLK